MSIDTTPTTVTPHSRPHSPEVLEALLDKQGVRESATLERQIGAGEGLWDCDAEFDELLKRIEAARRRKD